MRTGIQQGAGCVYPSAVTTIANQLDADGLTWKGYMEDMGNDPTREAANCGHPSVGDLRSVFTAEAGDGYVTRHDPFVYFHSIIDNTTECDQDVVPLGDTSGNMPAGTPCPGSPDWSPTCSRSPPRRTSASSRRTCATTATTTRAPTPPGRAGAWRSSVGDINPGSRPGCPIITTRRHSSRTACSRSPSTRPSNRRSTPPPAAARPPARPPSAATTGSAAPAAARSAPSSSRRSSPRAHGGPRPSYNHYSSLASIEDLFGLPRLGEAQTVTTTFDKHIYSK